MSRDDEELVLPLPIISNMADSIWVGDEEYMLIYNEKTCTYDRVKKEKTEYKSNTKKCDCGVASLGYDYGHSDWCSMVRTDGK